MGTNAHLGGGEGRGGEGGGQIENKTILDTFCFNTDYVFIQFTNKQYTIGQIFVKY